MDMGFKDPFKRHAYGLGSGQQLADRIVVDRSRGDVEIEHRIDRDPATRSGIPDQIADRIGRLVEEGADLRFDTHSTLPCLRGPLPYRRASFQILENERPGQLGLPWQFDNVAPKAT